MNANQINEVAALANCTADEAEAVINHDWDNAEEHAEWLRTASVSEIAAWVAPIARDARDA